MCHVLLSSEDIKLKTSGVLNQGVRLINKSNTGFPLSVTAGDRKPRSKWAEQQDIYCIKYKVVQR